MNLLSILILATGGSIDKDYLTNEDNHGLNFVIGIPAVKAILKRAYVNFDYEIKSILKKR